mgnify:CR=1 FL=1
MAETQYDTLAIEQSYLAEGQSRRVDDIRSAIKSLESLKFDPLLNKARVMMGSLVQMEQDIAKRHWFFITPAAGGYRCQSSGKINKDNFDYPTSADGKSTSAQRTR